MRSYAVVDALHRDAILHRTNEPAQIAADAFVLVNFRNTNWRSDMGAIAGMFFHVGYCDAFAACGYEIFGILKSLDVNALVCAIPASDVTKIAADAFIGMNFRDDFVI